MVVLWEYHYLLLLVTCIWSKWKNDIVMSSKIEKDVVKPSKPIFYHRFADDIYSRRKLGDNFLFDWLNSYDLNIEFAIQINTSKLLDTKITNINGTCKFNVYPKSTKLSSPWPEKLFRSQVETL